MMSRSQPLNSSFGVDYRRRTERNRRLRMEHLEHRLLLAVDVTGNGAPSGQHYNLNIIGTTAKKMEVDNGNVIFVPLAGKTKISLLEGDDFQVLDKNGTDGEAVFQLPN